jgi:hypothetical protein
MASVGPSVGIGDNYHDTRKEAKAFLLTRARAKVRLSQERWAEAINCLAKAYEQEPVFKGIMRGHPVKPDQF